MYKNRNDCSHTTDDSSGGRALDCKWFTEHKTFNVKIRVSQVRVLVFRKCPEYDTKLFTNMLV